MLGCEPRDDVELGDDFCWCTVGHPLQPELEVHLSTSGPPMSPDFVASITRALDEGRTFALGCAILAVVAVVALVQAP